VIVRSGPLTWAQVSMYQPIFWRHQGERFPLRLNTWRMRDAVTATAVAEAWAALARRHELLRSTFALSPTGRPVQHVHHPDDFAVPVRCAPMSEYEAFVAGERRIAFDGPLWSAVVFHDNGIARVSCLLAEHILYDAGGLRNWRGQLHDLVAEPHRGLDVVHPVDQANAEPSADHPRVRTAAQRYGESVARGAQVLIPAARQESPDRYLRSTATYPGLAAAVDAVSRHCQAPVPSVLTYVVGWLVARVARHRVLPLDLLYANRSARENSIGCQMQHVFFAVDFAPGSPAAGIKELARATIGVLARGRMPRTVAAQVRSSASAARGVDVKEPMMVNVLSGADARFDLDRGTGPATVVDEWNSGGTPYCNLVVAVVDGPDVEVSLDVDSAMFTRADTAAILADLPRAIEHVRDHPDLALVEHDWSSTPFPLTDGLVRAGQDWVRPHKVAALLAAVPGVHTAEVEVEGDDVIATVTHDGTVSYADLHEHLSCLVAQHGDVVVPTRFRGTRSDPHPWHLDDRPAVAPATEAEHVLRDVLRCTHGFTVDDFARTYVTAGCELDLVPAVVTGLAARGWTGLGSALFTAPVTLRTIARRLVRVP
jgi:hypothetical protein